MSRFSQVQTIYFKHRQSVWKNQKPIKQRRMNIKLKDKSKYWVASLQRIRNRELTNDSQDKKIWAVLAVHRKRQNFFRKEETKPLPTKNFFSLLWWRQAFLSSWIWYLFFVIKVATKCSHDASFLLVCFWYDLVKKRCCCFSLHTIKVREKGKWFSFERKKWETS